MRSAGNGSSAENVRRENAVTGPISTKRCLAHDAERAPARDRPGRVRAQAVRRLGEVEREALGEEQEAIEKAARQEDVVVDEQQPVVARRGRLVHRSRASG